MAVTTSPGEIPAVATPAPSGQPRALAAGLLPLVVVLSALGAVIGVRMIVTLGVTANTAVVGVLLTLLLARLPGHAFAGCRSMQVQNLTQTAISAATFGAANSLLLPMAVPHALGRPDLVPAMFAGAAGAMLLDAWLVYRMFGTPAFPAEGAWPPGVAAAQTIRAGDEGGRRLWILGLGLLAGAGGTALKLPMSAFAIALMGNVAALALFAAGLLLRAYAMPLFGIDLQRSFIPHGVMIGAAAVALVQLASLLRAGAGTGATPRPSQLPGGAWRRAGGSLGLGFAGFALLAAATAGLAGLATGLPPGKLVLFVLSGAGAAFLHELVVGIAAMHSGWFPAAALAMITVPLGLLAGFPPPAVALLCGFCAATGPAFADLGYAFKTGHLLAAGSTGLDVAESRRQQMKAAGVALLVAMPVAYAAHTVYFPQGLIPPFAKVYVAGLKAGLAPDVASTLLLAAIPGAIVQWLGGRRRQLGVMLATGLLIASPLAGWLVAAGVAVRLGFERLLPEDRRSQLEVAAGGMIAGDALWSFVTGLIAGPPKR